jgi:hypothetical protein
LLMQFVFNILTITDAISWVFLLSLFTKEQSL